MPLLLTVSQHNFLLQAPLIARERISSYRLTFQAVDGGVPSRSASALVILGVTDVNDNTPVFSSLENTTFTEGQQSASISPNLVLGDADSFPLFSATVSVKL